VHEKERRPFQESGLDNGCGDGGFARAGADDAKKLDRTAPSFRGPGPRAGRRFFFATHQNFFEFLTLGCGNP